MDFIKYWIPPIIMAVLIFTGSSFSLKNKMLPDIWNIDKVIHMIEYGIFAYLLWRALIHSKQKNVQINANFWAVAVAALYGISDEFHQYFVPNRNMSVFDAIADILGAIIVVKLCCLLSANRVVRNQQ